MAPPFKGRKRHSFELYPPEADALDAEERRTGQTRSDLLEVYLSRLLDHLDAGGRDLTVPLSTGRPTVRAFTLPPEVGERLAAAADSLGTKKVRLVRAAIWRGAVVDQPPER